MQPSKLYEKEKSHTYERMNGSGISITVIFYRYSEDSYEMRTGAIPSNSHKITQSDWVKKKVQCRNTYLLTFYKR